MNEKVLTPIPEPDISEFRKRMDAAASWATEIEMTKDYISSAIKAARKRRSEVEE